MDTSAARTVERSAGVASLVAGGIHGALTPSHFGEWWGYGLFFLAAAMAQLALGLAVLTNAVNAEDFGDGWRRAKRSIYAAGALGNLAILALYVVTRTVGIPFLGPGAGEVEDVGAVDVVSKVAEAVAVVLFALLWRRARADRETLSPGAR